MTRRNLPSIPKTAINLVLLAATMGLALGQTPKTELIWPTGAPGALGATDVDRPSLTIYVPPPNKASGTGVIVCPGGGYQHLAVDHEGTQIAEWLNAHGIAAFVLRYRIAPRYHHPAPIQDAQRAIRIVRSRAAE